MSPALVLRRASIAEAITWTLLIIGMILKYVTKTTAVGVTVFGLLHGLAFLSYCLVVLVVGVNQRWSFGRIFFGWLCAVPPWATIVFDVLARRRGWDVGPWRFTGTGHAPTEQPAHAAERVLALAVRRPRLSVALAALLIVAVTAVLVAIGPPGGK